MYPYLEPHGLILKINRQPLPGLSGEIVQRDRDYWTKNVTPMIGGWLKPDTTVEEIAAFAEKIYVKNDLSGFTGDPQFVQNEFWCKIFPNCGVPSPGFTPGARSTPLTPRKKNG